MSEVQILLVEDNEGDIILTREAFAEGKLLNTVNVVRDGEEAIQYLKKEGIYVDQPRPDIILMDINLPRMDGKAALEYIKSHPDYKTIPVVMLTTSCSEKDIRDSYDKSANCYITKPVDFSKFIHVIQSIENFWLTIVKLPHHQ